MISDVPLGAFLSGGIDSTAIVALMSRIATGPVKDSQSVSRSRNTTNLRYARQVAERFQTDHHEFVVRPDAAAVLPRLAWHYDEPFADSSAAPTYYVAQMTRAHVTVALNGDAGDESFGGYDRYVATLAASFTAGRARGFSATPSDGGCTSFRTGGTRTSLFYRGRRFLDGLDGNAGKAIRALVLPILRGSESRPLHPRVSGRCRRGGRPAGPPCLLSRE